VVITYDRRESLRKWATLLASTLALLVTSLRDPEAGWDNHLDAESEVLRRLDRDVAAMRDGAVASEVTYKLLLEMNNCLMAVETKLDVLMKERQRDRLHSSASAPQ